MLSLAVKREDIFDVNYGDDTENDIVYSWKRFFPLSHLVEVGLKQRSPLHIGQVEQDPCKHQHLSVPCRFPGFSEDKLCCSNCSFRHRLSLSRQHQSQPQFALLSWLWYSWQIELEKWDTGQCFRTFKIEIALRLIFSYEQYPTFCLRWSWCC